MLRAVLALVLGLGVTAGAYVAGQRIEEDVEARLFDEQVQRVGQVATARMAGVLDPVESFGLFAELREVNAATFVPELKGRHDVAPALRAMAWLPVVKERELFEKQVQRYFQGFEIREQTAEGVVQTAGPATAWVPFLLIEPEHGNDLLRGLDIGNLGPLAQTMQQTYMRHAPVASPLFEFTGIDEPVILVLFYVPQPEGFAGALVEPGKLVEVVTQGRPAGMVVRLTDDTTGTVLLEEAGFAEEGSSRFATSLGGRTFSMDVAAGPDFEPTQLQLALPAGLAGGGVGVLMLALVLLGGKREDAAS
jgi:hypothetical protein